MEQPKFDKMTSLLLELGLRITNDVLCKGSTPLTPDEFDKFVRYAVKNQYTTLRDYGDGWLPSGFKTLIEYQRHAISQELILYTSSKYYGQTTTKDAVLLNKSTVPACTEKKPEEPAVDETDVTTPITSAEPEEIILDKPECSITVEDIGIKVDATGPTELEKTETDGPFAGLEEFMVDEPTPDNTLAAADETEFDDLAPAVPSPDDRPAASVSSVEDEF